MDFGLYKRGNVWYHDFYVNDVRYRQSTKTKSKELALAYSRKLYTELYQCGYELKKDDVKIIVSEYVEEYLGLLENNISFEWLKNVRYILNQFLEYIQDKATYLDQITPKLLEEYRNHRLTINKKSTVKTAMVCISAMLNKAVKYEYTTKNPAKQLEPLRGIVETRVRFLSKEEIPKVIDACKGTYFENIVITAIHTGMRRRELIYLEYQDIDIEKKLIYIRNKKEFQTKSRKDKVVPLHDRLIPILSQKKEGIVFPYSYIQKSNGIHHKRDIIQEDTLTRNFIDKAKRIGLTDVEFHTLRHTFVSHALMSGVNIWEVGKWIGHSTTRMTEMYGHLCPERREIQKLNF